ncbi:transcriptional repressor LexA [bacterium]|nr:transcriptional repressor LexA [bacterium]
MYLTRRQREVFEFIRGFIDENGYSPSLEEVAKGLDLSSLATVHKHLTNLSEKGMIRRHWNRGRGIEICSDLGQPSMVSMELEACYAIPIRGTVAAGEPLDVEEDLTERLSVPSDLVRNAEQTFVLRVRGDSMIDEGICEGDFIICERRSEARNGQVVVALVGGHETTVKKFYRESPSEVRLQPANPYMAPIYVKAADVAIQGVVIGLVRRYDA